MLLYSSLSISVRVMKTMTIKVTVPDEVDPEDVFSHMTADFFYNNRHTDDIGPYMDQILWEIVLIEADIKTA